MIKAVIFDIDGTLINTAPGIRAAAAHALRERGHKELGADEFEEFIRLSPLAASFRSVCALSEEETVRCCALYREFYALNSAALSEIYPGGRELLDYLREQGLRLGIATYKQQDNAEILLDALGIRSCFACVRGALSGRSLTKLEILRECVGALGLEPSECLFTGDSPSDGRAALEAGCPFAAALYGYGFRSAAEALELKPRFLTSALSDLGERLRGGRV